MGQVSSSAASALGLDLSTEKDPRISGGATRLTRNPGNAQGLFCRTAATPEPTAYESSGEEVWNMQELWDAKLKQKMPCMTGMIILLFYNLTFVPDPNQIVLVK